MSDEPTDAGAICFSRLRESNAGFTRCYPWEGVIRPAATLILRGSLTTGWPDINLPHLFKTMYEIFTLMLTIYTGISVSVENADLKRQSKTNV